MKTKLSLLIGLIWLFVTGVMACAAPRLAAETAVPPISTPQSPVSITDPDLVLTPAPLTTPAVGSSVVEPVFGSTLRRLTDTGNSGFGTHIYSQLQAFSADNQYILLIENEW